MQMLSYFFSLILYSKKPRDRFHLGHHLYYMNDPHHGIISVCIFSFYDQSTDQSWNLLTNYDLLKKISTFVSSVYDPIWPNQSRPLRISFNIIGSLTTTFARFLGSYVWSSTQVQIYNPGIL